MQLSITVSRNTSLALNVVCCIRLFKKKQDMGNVKKDWLVQGNKISLYRLNLQTCDSVSTMSHMSVQISPLLVSQEHEQFAWVSDGC